MKLFRGSGNERCPLRVPLGIRKRLSTLEEQHERGMSGPEPFREESVVACAMDEDEDEDE